MRPAIAAAVFSPDGKEIAFYSNRSDTYNVFAIKPDGSGLHAVTEDSGGNNRNLLYPIYSPSGDRLFASRSRSPETLVVDPRRPWKDQKAEAIDTRLPDGSWLIPTAWSPDARRWAGTLTNSAGSTVGLGLLDVASHAVRRLIEGSSAFLGIVWLQDSRRVVFVDPNTGTINLMDVETGRRRELAHGLPLGLGLVVSPDQRTFYVSTTRQQADIWMVTLGAAR